MTDLPHRIGEQARAARKALGLTQADVAEEVGIAPEVYGRLERGGMMPSVTTLLKLAKALRVSPDVLLAQATPPTSTPEKRPALRRIVRLLERADDATVGRVLIVVAAMLDGGRRASTTPRKRRASGRRGTG